MRKLFIAATQMRPLLESLAFDPILGRVKLIAEAWDAGGLYQVGSFPSWNRWAEWNGKYRDTVRAAFLSRRKTLENNLMNAFSLPREAAASLLRGAGIPDKARGETLFPEQLAALSDEIFDMRH